MNLIDNSKNCHTGISFYFSGLLICFGKGMSFSRKSVFIIYKFCFMVMYRLKSLTLNKYSIEGLEAYISVNKLTDEDWTLVSIYQELTEEFIDKYSNKFNWESIIIHQKLSYSFMEKHLYMFSLYIRSDVNMENITKLREVYKEKYIIDKLAYELNS